MLRTVACAANKGLSKFNTYADNKIAVVLIKFDMWLMKSPMLRSIIPNDTSEENKTHERFLNKQLIKAAVESSIKLEKERSHWPKLSSMGLDLSEETDIAK